MSKSVSRAVLLSWCLLGALMLFMNWCTPMAADDWGYAQGGWGDIVRLTWERYMEWNSRLASTALTACFSHLPVPVVDVVNTLGFLLVAGLSLYLAFGKDWKRYACRWQSVWLVWVLSVVTVPVFGEVFLWHCGSASYMWVHLCAMGMLALLRPLFDEAEPGSGGKAGSVRIPLLLLPLLCGMAMVSGCSNYHTGPAILLTCAVITFFFRSRIRPAWAMYTILAFSALTCALMLMSPGNAGRMEAIESGAGTQDITRVRMFFRLLAPHARSIPLYILLFFAIRWRRLRYCWSHEDRVIFWGSLAVAVVTQGAFMASPATPPMRSWQITFALVNIAALRVLLPIITELRPGKLLSWILVLLAALLLALGLPQLWQEKQWISRAEAVMEAKRGSGADIRLPYWHFTKDYLFCFQRNYVSSYDPEDFCSKGAASFYGLGSVMESDLRCAYQGGAEGWNVSGMSYDGPRHATRTEWKLSAPEASEPAFLLVAHPDKNSKYWNPIAVIRRMLAGDDISQQTVKELKKQGYKVESLQTPPFVHGETFVTWERVKKYSKKPAAPVIWVRIAPCEARDGTTLIRLDPAIPLDEIL